MCPDELADRKRAASGAIDHSPATPPQSTDGVDLAFGQGRISEVGFPG
jgi:hypothetical protein